MFTLPWASTAIIWGARPFLLRKRGQLLPPFTILVYIIDEELTQGGGVTWSRSSQQVTWQVQTQDQGSDLPSWDLPPGDHLLEELCLCPWVSPCLEQHSEATKLGLHEWLLSAAGALGKYWYNRLKSVAPGCCSSITQVGKSATALQPVLERVNMPCLSNSDCSWLQTPRVRLVQL